MDMPKTPKNRHHQGDATTSKTLEDRQETFLRPERNSKREFSKY
jgi:hypothetical protein